ncbi:MAG: tyrosine--tRNA ligase [Spirochaetales bacterium]
MKSVLDILKERGFVKQTVFEEDLQKELDSKMVSFYVGFDPTADSLTIGHFLPIIAMMHLQKAGHKPYALIGGGTAYVGDPSGRSDMRKMMSPKTIEANVRSFENQLSKYLNFDGKNGAVIVNNADWLLKLNYIDFLNELGADMSVNRMLSFDCFKTRWEKGLTFLEFNYMPMQAYDFLHLHRKYGVNLQVGGDDQWANMLAGADLIRRKQNDTAYVLTIPLLLKADGSKMGKSAKGALWIDKERTSPYEIYQYLRNTEDAKVAEYLKRMTFLSLAEIDELTKHQDERINKAKEVLAYEFVKIVHGEADANDARNQAKAAFGGDSDNMPNVELVLNGDETVADILCLAGICKTKSEGRRLIEAGAVKVDERQIDSVSDGLTKEEFNSRAIVLHKGKKTHLRVNF